MSPTGTMLTLRTLSVAALLLAHLYGMGATDEDIVSFIENTDEIDDDTNFVKLLNTAKQQIIR